MENVQIFDGEQFGGFSGALGHWLGGLERPPLRRAYIAVAGPVKDSTGGGRVTMTNLNWEICSGRLRQEFDLRQVKLINDFTVLAHSLSLVDPAECKLLHEAESNSEAVLAVIGPGVAGLTWKNDRYRAIVGEGGRLRPRSSRWMAKLWRRECTDTFLNPAFPQYRPHRPRSAPRPDGLNIALTHCQQHKSCIKPAGLVQTWPDGATSEKPVIVRSSLH